MDDPKLSYPGLDDIVVKTVGYSHNFFLRGELKNKKLKIDDFLTVLDDKTDIRAVSYLKKFVSEARKESDTSGTFFSFVHDPKKSNRPYDAMDRIRVFATAVRIFTGMRADALYDFSIKDIKKKIYFLPFDLTGGRYDPYGRRKTSVISSKADFNTIKKIHANLIKAKIEKTLHYSKLYNATEFFRHGYEEHWTLLKTTLFFTALESLFSDSSKSEVTEKISVRTAYLLYPKDSTKRKEVYTFIKRGYEIRSLFVHGSNTEAGVNKIMKKFEKDKGSDNYSFHLDFIEDLHQLVCDCLKECYLNNDFFLFFTKEKYKEQEEQSFYRDLVL